MDIRRTRQLQFDEKREILWFFNMHLLLDTRRIIESTVN